MDVVNTTGNTALWQDPARLAAGGWTLQDVKDNIDATLAAARTVPAPDYVLINIGVNDVTGGTPDATTWKGNLAYVLDALKTKWASVQVGIEKVWRQGAGYQAALDTLDDTYVPDVLASRPWAFQGPDERIFLKNGDDGATYTTDGVHPNAAGYQLEAQEWATLLGL